MSVLVMLFDFIHDFVSTTARGTALWRHVKKVYKALLNCNFYFFCVFIGLGESY